MQVRIRSSRQVKVQCTPLSNKWTIGTALRCLDGLTRMCVSKNDPSLPGPLEQGVNASEIAATGAVQVDIAHILLHVWAGRSRLLLL
jgi:hypothetical protein